MIAAFSCTKPFISLVTFPWEPMETIPLEIQILNPNLNLCSNSGKCDLYFLSYQNS